MRHRKRIVFVVAACVLLAVLCAVVPPQTVRAAIATLVRDQDNPARHPFAASCSTASFSSDTTSCSIQVPAGVEYVVQALNVEGSPVCCPYVIPTTSNVTIMTHTGGALFQARYATTFTPYGGGAVWMPLTVPLTIYADPGSNIDVSLVTPGSVPGGMNFAVRAQGYYVTLP